MRAMTIDDLHDLDGDDYFGRLAPWVPTPSLTIEKLQGLEGVRPPLTEVLCLMTFGDPKGVELPDNILAGEFHLLRPAYKALFEAGRPGKVKFLGSRKQFGTPSEELSVAEFVPERMWDHRYESIDSDLFGVRSMAQFKAAHERKHQPEGEHQTEGGHQIW
jgi:hypothetical protein